MPDESPTAARQVRSYSISVEGFPEHVYHARSPAKARAACWRENAAWRECSFRDFLTISRIRAVPNPRGVGERVMVCGEPATTAGMSGQYVRFFRDGHDMALLSHPADVERIVV